MAGVIDGDRVAVALSRTPSRLVSGAPEYGEHTDEILLEIGYSQQDIAQFRQSGAI
jgi:crotonobetainyl-CoA:carnitine CoA-transferase CaiB-like acyl-CoA transferase